MAEACLPWDETQDYCSAWYAKPPSKNAVSWRALKEDKRPEILILTTDLPLEDRFRKLAQEWESDTAFLSSTTKRVMHPNYQMIIGMGRDVVPLLLRDLQRNRRVWFWALTHITGVNPVEPGDAGNIDKMTKTWLEWGKSHGLYNPVDE